MQIVAALVATLRSLTGTIAEPSQCCQLLQNAGLERVFFPDEPTYLERVQSYWSLTSQLSPGCFVQPQTTHEVSTAVKLLVRQTECRFAVRSGGHSSNSGFNNIAHGVTIDLGQLNDTQYDPVTRLASLRPGTRWIDVYKTLDALDVGVQGGGIGTVGVGGLLLGGGFSPYLYQRGFAADDIRKMEVVLASGEIIEASVEKNRDLYQVLKGGGSGFGIVTRFDMETFDRTPLWSAYREFPESAAVNDAHIIALKRWTDNPSAYQCGSAFIWWTYRPAVKHTIIISALADTAGQVEPEALEEFLSIRGYTVSEVGLTNMSTSAQLAQAPNYRNIWFTLTFKNDERVIRRAVELHQQLVEDMKENSSDGDFETLCYFQPFPSIIGERGAQKGGNILGVDQLADNAIVLQGSLAVNGKDQERMGRKKLLAWRDSLENYSREMGAFVAYRYSNYADASQHVLASYGQANVQKMRNVSAKYDPNGIFQIRAPGGFKMH
ncbi:FAD-binding domain-containing protein [Pyrenochaeta sp. DS3sAY3a]|nr:FAD-binding domain-containing protein [Pyrenochaeta sp. DS3sAY3a]